MKKLFFTALFVIGASTAGFSQIYFAGKASITLPGDNTMVVSCNGEGTCAKITMGLDKKVHVLIPDYELDIIIEELSVGGVDWSLLPKDNPNGDYIFEYVPSKE